MTQTKRGAGEKPSVVTAQNLLENFCLSCFVLTVRMSGRKKDPIWQHFREIRDLNKKGSRAICIKCQKEMQGIPQRLKDHYNSCSTQDASSTRNQEEEVQDQEPSTSTVRPSTSIGSTDDCILLSPPPPPKKKCNPQPLSTFVLRTSEELKQKIDIQIAKAVYATNSSFRCIEHPQVIKAIEMLRPGYKPPSRFDLGNRLLDEVHNEEKQKCFSTVKDQTVNLFIDGWSNVHNDPIICSCITTESGEVYLLESIDTTGKPHNADYLTEISKDLIKKCKDEYKCRAASFVTDNAAAMSRMRRELRNDSEEDILTYGCAAHILNLLSKDLDVKEVREHVVQIVKYFTYNHFASAKYKQLGGRSLVVPQEVRWNTHADCFEIYLSEWQKILKICEDYRDSIDRVIYQKVTNMVIKRSAEDMLKIYKPIAISLDSLQKSNASLSDAVEIFKQLEATFEEVDANMIQLSALKNRYDMALTPAHFLAYMLDPSKIKFNLTAEEEAQALNFAQNEYPGTGLLPLIVKFKARTDPFKAVMFSDEVIKNVTPLQWWKSQLSSLDGQGLLKPIFHQLFTAVASSASVERVFSTFGLVQSKLRNRLGNEKAGKLVFLYKYYNK